MILFPGPAHRLFRVREGLVRLHTVDGDGSGLTLRYVKPGGYFGEESLRGEPRRYYAEAVADSQIDITTPAELSPEETLLLATHLAEALQGLYESLKRLSGKRLKARVAAELLELRDSAIAVRSPAGVIVHITHDELAAAVGSVRETVTKVIGELAKDGALEAGYGKIVLKSAARLRELAEA